MPLLVQHCRPHPDGLEMLSYRWGYWHLGCIIAAFEDEHEFPEDHHTSYDDIHRYEFKNRHGYEDPTDGERMEILPGDYFTFSR